MGTGSYGGGSGSFGGGGSGGGGGRLGAGGAVHDGRGQRRTGSVLERVRDLIAFTDRVNRVSGIELARKAVSDALKLPARSKYLHGLIADSFVDSVFREVLAIDERAGEAIDWSVVAEYLGLPKEQASPRALVGAIIAKHSTHKTDERFVDIVRNVLTDLFLHALGNDNTLYLEGRPAAMTKRFDRQVLKRFCGHFLSRLMREVIRRDLTRLSSEAGVHVQRATAEMAGQWVDLFEEEFHGGAVHHRDMLTLMAAQYRTFSGLTQ